MINPASTPVDFSSLESGILGLKISRCLSEFFNEKELYQQVAVNRYDLCRLKVPAEDEFASERLHKTGLPFFFSGSIRKYHTRFADNPTVTFRHPDLIFELFDGTQEKLLKDMLASTWGNYPLGYYRSPYLSDIITREQETECVYQFYKRNTPGTGYLSNQIIFMKKGDQYVGLFALNVNGNTVESNLAGILDPYRGDGYFLEAMNYQKDYGLKNNMEYYATGARNENAHVQRLFQHLGSRPVGNDNVFHVTSFLTYSKIPPVIKEIKAAWSDSKSVYQQLFNEAHFLAEKMGLPHGKMSFRVNNENCLLTKASHQLKFSFPIITDQKLLIVIQSDDSGCRQFTGYLSAFSC